MRDILKAAAKVGFGTMAGLLASVITGKVLAVELGAAGVGLYGVLRQLLQTLGLLGSFNGQSALVQGIARQENAAEQVQFSGSVFSIQMSMAAGLALVLFVGAPWLGPWLIPHPQAVSLLRWLALATVILVANLYILGLLNGHRLVNDIVKFQMIGVVATLSLVFPAVWLIREGLSFGFLLMLTGSALIVTLLAARALHGLGLLPRLDNLRINNGHGAQFLHMSTILTVAGILATGAQFSQSWLVAKWIGLANAGQFWAAWTLSMSYLTLLLTALGTYYLPSLSGIKDGEARRALIRTYLEIVLLFVPVLIVVVVVFKPWVIHGMFSAAMLPALDVMRWMLIGDFFKAVSYVLAYPMLAFNDMKWFFWTDVLFSIGMAAASLLWIVLGGGIEGLGVIFMISYVLFLAAAIAYIKIKHGFVFVRQEAVRFLAGLLLIVAASIMTWHSQSVSVREVAGMILLLALYGIFSLRGFDWRALKLLRRK